jgi:hydroxymethylglutaryl-CoA reductase (NADPH)
VKSLHKLAFDKRQAELENFTSQKFPTLFLKNELPDAVDDKNCENWIGSVAIPVGVAGPLSFTFEGVDYNSLFPLATTEGALVASVNRGLKLLNQNSQILCTADKHGMTRAPVFECQNVHQAKELKDFIANNFSKLKKVAETTSNHLTYKDCQTFIRGKFAYARFVFDTDEAMGMNMTTIATQAMADFLEVSLKGVRLISLSSNACTDKKDNMINTLLGRGFEVQVEVVLKSKLIKKVLKTEIKDLVKVHIQKNLVGSNIAGSLSQNAQVSNIVAAMYLATGQDPAHIVEGSKAFLQMEQLNEEELYVSLSLPNLNVGVVGGGTYLPAQSEARKLLNSGQEITGRELSVMVGVAALAGELSLLASLSKHTLACSHQKLGRSKV